MSERQKPPTVESANERKLARNQAIFREINERIRELGNGFAAATSELEILCECSNDHCTTLITVPLDEYERVRSTATRFLLQPGHELPKLERIVELQPGYETVEKFGSAASVVASLAPRQRTIQEGARR